MAVPGQKKVRLPTYPVSESTYLRGKKRKKRKGQTPCDTLTLNFLLGNNNVQLEDSDSQALSLCLSALNEYFFHRFQ